VKYKSGMKQGITVHLNFKMKTSFSIRYVRIVLKTSSVLKIKSVQKLAFILGDTI